MLKFPSSTNTYNFNTDPEYYARYEAGLLVDDAGNIYVNNVHINKIKYVSSPVVATSTLYSIGNFAPPAAIAPGFANTVPSTTQALEKFTISSETSSVIEHKIPSFSSNYRIGHSSSAQSDTDGYTIGGLRITDSDMILAEIDENYKFPFSSEVSISTSSFLSSRRLRTMTASSQDKAFVMGGATFYPQPGSLPLIRGSVDINETPTTPGLSTDIVETFPFVSPGITVLSQTLADAHSKGVSLEDTTAGYYAAYNYVSPPSSIPSKSTAIHRFPFASNVNGVKIGDMVADGDGQAHAAAPDLTNGFILTPRIGSVSPFAPPYTRQIVDIQKFNFQNDTISSEVGTVDYGPSYPFPVTGYVHGIGAGSAPDRAYLFGGYLLNGTPDGLTDSIQSFPFSIISGTATEIGTLNTPSASVTKAISD